MHVTAGRHYDDRRNTSALRLVPAGHAELVLEHLRANRDAEWYRWATEGQPRLSEARYEAVRRRK